MVMQINPNSKYKNIIPLHLWKKRWYRYSLKVLLVLKILYFSSVAPEALLRLTKYLSIPESSPIVEELTKLVEKQNSNALFILE